MKDALDFIVKSLVDTPEKVHIGETTDDLGQTILTIAVDPSDMGKVIGKSGKIIKAVRTLIKIIATKNQRRIQIELLEASKD